MGRVGINTRAVVAQGVALGVAPPTTPKARSARPYSGGALRRPPRSARSARPSSGASPPRAPTPTFHHITRIIYALVTVTNNSAKKQGSARGRSPPQTGEARSVVGGATPQRVTESRHERLREWRDEVTSRRTQTSTPSTNPYDSN